MTRKSHTRTNFEFENTADRKSEVVTWYLFQCPKLHPDYIASWDINAMSTYDKGNSNPLVSDGNVSYVG